MYKIILILLLLGTLCLNSLFSSQFFFALGLISILFILFKSYEKNIDNSRYILIILFLSFFDYSSFKGSLWNYINIIFLLYLLVSQKWKPSINKSHSMALSVLIFTTLLGNLFVNTGEISENIFFQIVFLSYIMMFLFINTIKFNYKFFHRFTKLLAIIVIWQFLICVNQRFEFFVFKLPFFPVQKFVEDLELRDLSIGINKIRNWGSLSNFELFAEINSMLFVFYFSLLLYNKSIIRILKFDLFVKLICVFSFLNILMSGTRSSFILALLFMLFLLLFKLKSFLTNIKKFTILIFIVFSMIFFSSWIIKQLGLETFVMRVEFVNISEINFANGKGMNRDGTFDLAFKRLNQESLLIGNGYSFGTNYLKIMRGEYDSQFSDYHNLYLSLPFFYGWFGSFCLLFVFLIPFFKLLLKKSELRLNFILLWLIFFINEYKIQFIRDPQYTMIIWIFLGLTYCYLKSIRINKSFLKS